MTITVTSMGSNSTNIAFSAGEAAANVAAAVETYILTKGWSVHDSSASATSKCYKAPCVDGVVYKYALLNWTLANSMSIQVYEHWNASTHVGYNRASAMDGTAAFQPLTLSSGGNLYVFATARYFAILSRTNLGAFGGTVNGITQHGAQGCFELERANVEDTPTIAVGGVSVATWTNKTSGTFSGSGNYYDVPLTGGTGTGAKATIIIIPGSPNAIGYISSPGSGYTVGDILIPSIASFGGGTAVGFKLTVQTIGLGVPPFVWLDTTNIGSLNNYAGNINYAGSSSCWGGAVSFCRTKLGINETNGSVFTGILTPYGVWGSFGLSIPTATPPYCQATANPVDNCCITSLSMLPSADVWSGKNFAIDMIAIGDTFNRSKWDIRGRIYGLKCLQHGVGITFDTVNIKIDADGWTDPNGILTPFYITNGSSNFRFGLQT